MTLHWNGSAWSSYPVPVQAQATISSLALTQHPPITCGQSAITATALSCRRESCAGTVLPGISCPTLPTVLVTTTWRISTVVNATYVWATGYYNTGTQFQSMIMRWDGNTWSTVPSPNVGTATYLVSGAAFSASDAWIVGRYSNGSLHLTMTLHWNGTAWSIVPSRDGDTIINNRLRAITAVSANDVWAVGTYDTGIKRANLHHALGWRHVESDTQPQHGLL